MYYIFAFEMCVDLSTDLAEAFFGIRTIGFKCQVSADRQVICYYLSMCADIININMKV